MEEFPANSHRAKRPPQVETPAIAESKRKVERVVQGEVIRRKRPLSKRFRELFVPQDAPSVKEYVIQDILAPYFRDMVVDATIGSVERMVYGESRMGHRRGGGRPGGIGPVAYNAFASKPVGRSAARDDRPQISRRARAMHDFEEILLPSRQEAVTVLDGMYAILEQYNEVGVRDLYELLGISANFAEMNWGWTDLMGAGVSRTRNGHFVLDLPQPKYLER